MELWFNLKMNVFQTISAILAIAFLVGFGARGNYSTQDSLYEDPLLIALFK